MFRIGYKVVRTGKGTFWSAMRCTVGRTKYVPYRWTMPLANFGPLTLFRDLKSALDWIQKMGMAGNRSFRLRRCLFIPSRVIPVPQIRHIFDDAVPIVWAEDGTFEPLQNLPPGTILAKKVMVI